LFQVAETTLKSLVEMDDPKTRAIFSTLTDKTKQREVISAAKRISSCCKTLVVLGTGGSSLGAKTLVKSLKRSTNVGYPKVLFFDNLSPGATETFFKEMVLSETHFLVISSSGNTLEVLAHFLLALEFVAKKITKNKLMDHFSIITGPGDNPLRVLGENLGLTIYDHDPDLTGRFSAFSNVSLVPAAIAGVDISAFLEGGNLIFSQAVNTNSFQDLPIVKGAIFSTTAETHGNCSAHVMMPYVNKLNTLSKWFVQLWAESLGKKGRGTIPIAALGPIDQHSQLQMYLDGRQDKFFSFIRLHSETSSLGIDGYSELDPRLALFNKKTLQDVVNASYYGTVTSIVKAHRPARTFHLDILEEKTLGGLMMHFMLETIMVAGMLEVAPFEQDRVEDGKKHARQHLKDLSANLI